MTKLPYLPLFSDQIQGAGRGGSRRSRRLHDVQGGRRAALRRRRPVHGARALRQDHGLRQAARPPVEGRRHQGPGRRQGQKARPVTPATDHTINNDSIYAFILPHIAKVLFLKYKNGASRSQRCLAAKRKVLVKIVRA